MLIKCVFCQYYNIFCPIGTVIVIVSLNFYPSLTSRTEKSKHFRFQAIRFYYQRAVELHVYACLCFYLAGNETLHELHYVCIVLCV